MGRDDISDEKLNILSEIDFFFVTLGITLRQLHQTLSQKSPLNNRGKNCAVRCVSLLKSLF